VKFSEKILITASLLLAGFVAAQAIEPASPQFEGIDLRLLEDNMASRQLGIRGLRLNLYGGGIWVYDDNIFSTNTNTQKDSIWVQTLGSSLVYDRGAGLDLNLSAVYRHFDFHNTKLGYETYKLAASGNLDVFNSTVLTLDGGHSRDVGPVDPVLAFANIVTETDSMRVALAHTLSDRTGVSLSLGSRQRRYIKDWPGSDSKRHEVIASAYHSLNPKTRLLAELISEFNRYDGSAQNNSDIWQTNVGVTHSFTDKIAATAKVGYQDRNYDQTLAGDRNFADFVYSLSLNFQPNPHWQHTLSMVQTAVESEASNFYKYQRYAFDTVYSPVNRLKLSGGVFIDDMRPSANVAASDRFGAQFAITYALSELLTTGVSYKYTTKNSDNATAEYSRNVTALGVWLTF